MSVEIFSAAELAENDAYHLPGYVLLAGTTILSPIISWVLARYVTPPLYRWCERVLSTQPDRSALLVKVWRGPGIGTALLFSFMFFQLLELLNLTYFKTEHSPTSHFRFVDF